MIFMSLCALQSHAHISLVVTNRSYSNSVRQNSIEDVIREPFQICAAQVLHEWVKAQRVIGDSANMSVQLSPELIAKAVGDSVVAAQNSVHVLLDGRVILPLSSP